MFETAERPEQKTILETSQVKPHRPHLPFLDGVRALAAVFVVTSHVSGYVPDLAPWVRSPFLFNNIAVALFIALSGYSLMLAVAVTGSLKGGSLGYYWRRFRRILPPYFAAVILSAVLGRTLISNLTDKPWDYCLPVTKPEVLVHLTFAQDFFPKSIFKINYPLWTVSIESHIYLLFPLVVLAFSRWRDWGVASVGLAAGIVVQIYLNIAHPSKAFYGLTFLYFGLFLSGCFAARLSVLAADRLRWYPAAVAISCVLGTPLIALLYSRVFGKSDQIVTDAPLGVACVAILLALGSGQWPHVRRILSWRPLITIGTFAYSIYLIHAPILQLVWQYLVRPLNLHGVALLGVLNLVTVPTVIGLAWLFYLAFERPFISGRVPGDRKAAP